MTIRATAFAAISAATFATAVSAQGDPDATAQGDVSVTIYNSGQALVQDVRRIDIAAGRSTIAFPDVSAMIRPETLSFAAEGTGIVEQNFDFDLLTPQKLMEKAVGQTVTLLRTNPATGPETRERATVLHQGPVLVVDGHRDGGLVFGRHGALLRAGVRRRQGKSQRGQSAGGSAFEA